MTNSTTSELPEELNAPRERSQRSRESVTIDNWQEAPQNSWAFSHVDEIVPTVSIRRNAASASPDRQMNDTHARLDHAVPDLASFLANSYTDAFLVVQHDQIVDERYFGEFSQADRHLLMSVSKSLCGLTVGRLVDRGLLDTSLAVAHYVPDLEGSAYGDATVQQVLDMAVAVTYNEDYEDPDSEVQAQDRVAGWRSRRQGDPANTYAFLSSLRKSGEHGRTFQYCSAGTDVLAWIVENVTGQPYADTVATELWSRLDCDDDALITMDPGGFAFANGGISCTTRDLARVGRLMLNSGHVGGSEVISERWIRDTTRGNDTRLASGSAYQRVHPSGSYRNQWWVTGNDRGNFYAIGIHGQFIWVDPPSNSVIVKFSSWPEAITEDRSRTHAAMFRAVSEALS